MDKLFVLDYLSPCFINWELFDFIFFVLLCNYLSRMKTNGSCIYVSNIANCNAHLDFRGMQVFCVVLQKKCCSDHPLV